MATGPFSPLNRRPTSVDARPLKMGQQISPRVGPPLPTSSPHFDSTIRFKLCDPQPTSPYSITPFPAPSFICIPPLSLKRGVLEFSACRSNVLQGRRDRIAHFFFFCDQSRLQRKTTGNRRPDPPPPTLSGAIAADSFVHFSSNILSQCLCFRITLYRESWFQVFPFVCPFSTRKDLAKIESALL